MKPTFADMMETLARLVKRDSDRLLRERGQGIEVTRDNRIDVKPGPVEWTIERTTQFGTTPLFAVSPALQVVRPITRDPSTPVDPSRYVLLSDVRWYDWALAPTLRGTPDPMPWVRVRAPKSGPARERREPALRKARTAEDYSVAWSTDFDPNSTVTLNRETGNWTGKRFNAADSDRTIVAAVRRDIADAIRTGGLPRGMKVSVLGPARGRAMQVVVTDVPGVWLIDPKTAREAQWSLATEARSAITRRLEAIVRNYSYSRRTEGADYEPRSLTDRMPFDVVYDESLIAQQMQDAQGVDAGEREDKRLADSITRALRLSSRSPFAVRAVILGPSHWRIEWRTTRHARALYGPKPPPVLNDQHVTSPGEALEFARAWHLETKASR